MTIISHISGQVNGFDYVDENGDIQHYVPPVEGKNTDRFVKYNPSSDDIHETVHSLIALGDEPEGTKVHPAITQLWAMGYKDGDVVKGKNIVPDKQAFKSLFGAHTIMWEATLIGDNLSIETVLSPEQKKFSKVEYFEDGLGWLAHENEYKGIYYSLNRGLSDDEIKAEGTVYEWACEADHLTKAEQRILRDKFKLSSTISLPTAKSIHNHWAIKDKENITPDEWKNDQTQISYIFGSDPANGDLPRVLRLAGFNHLAYSPDSFSNTLLSSPITYTYIPLEICNHELSYTCEEFRAALLEFEKEQGVQPYTTERKKAYVYVNGVLTSFKKGKMLAAFEKHKNLNADADDPLWNVESSPKKTYDKFIKSEILTTEPKQENEINGITFYSSPEGEIQIEFLDNVVTYSEQTELLFDLIDELKLSYEQMPEMTKGKFKDIAEKLTPLVPKANEEKNKYEMPRRGSYIQMNKLQKDIYSLTKNHDSNFIKNLTQISDEIANYWRRLNREKEIYDIHFGEIGTNKLTPQAHDLVKIINQQQFGRTPEHRKENDDFYQEIKNKGIRVLILDANKSLGKTHEINHILTNVFPDEPGASFVNTIALGKAQETRLKGFFYRTNIAAGSDQDEALCDAHRVILCGESLKRTAKRKKINEVCVIDETVAFLNAIKLGANANREDERAKHAAVLISLLKNAERDNRFIIISDADFRNVELNFFREILGKETPFAFLRNIAVPKFGDVTLYTKGKCPKTGTNATQKDVRIYWFNKLVADIQAGNTAAMPSVAKKHLKVVLRMLRKRFPELKDRMKIITSDNSQEKEELEFLSDINGNIALQNLVFFGFSPSLGAGVDIPLTKEYAEAKRNGASKEELEALHNNYFNLTPYFDVKYPVYNHLVAEVFCQTDARIRHKIPEHIYYVENSRPSFRNGSKSPFPEEQIKIPIEDAKEAWKSFGDMAFEKYRLEGGEELSTSEYLAKAIKEVEERESDPWHKLGAFLRAREVYNCGYRKEILISYMKEKEGREVTEFKVLPMNDELSKADKKEIEQEQQEMFVEETNALVEIEYDNFLTDDNYEQKMKGIKNIVNHIEQGISYENYFVDGADNTVVTSKDKAFRERHLLENSLPGFIKELKKGFGFKERTNEYVEKEKDELAAEKAASEALAVLLKNDDSNWITAQRLRYEFLNYLNKESSTSKELRDKDFEQFYSYFKKFRETGNFNLSDVKNKKAFFDFCEEMKLEQFLKKEVNAFSTYENAQIIQIWQKNRKKFERIFGKATPLQDSSIIRWLNDYILIKFGVKLEHQKDKDKNVNLNGKRGKIAYYIPSDVLSLAKYFGKEKEEIQKEEDGEDNGALVYITDKRFRQWLKENITKLVLVSFEEKYRRIEKNKEIKRKEQARYQNPFSFPPTTTNNTEKYEQASLFPSSF